MVYILEGNYFEGIIVENIIMGVRIIIKVNLEYKRVCVLCFRLSSSYMPYPYLYFSLSYIHSIHTPTYCSRMVSPGMKVKGI